MNTLKPKEQRVLEYLKISDESYENTKAVLDDMLIVKTDNNYYDCLCNF